MPNKAKTITEKVVNGINKVYGKNSPNVLKTVTLQGDILVDLEIKKRLTYEEMLGFITSTVEGSFIDNEYVPFNTNLWVFINLMKYYVVNFKEGVTINELYELSLNTVLKKAILDEVDRTQIESIDRDIQDMIDFRKQMLLSKTSTASKLDSLFDSAISLIDSISKSAESFEPNKLSSEIQNVISSLEGKGLNVAEIINLISNEGNSNKKNIKVNKSDSDIK